MAGNRTSPALTNDASPEDVDLAIPTMPVSNPLRRAWLAAYAITGQKRRACRIVGVAPTTPRSPAWVKDPEFVAGLQLAEQMIGDRMEDEARRRALDGITQYKFTKGGDPLLHPTMCECGHALRVHAEWQADPDSSSERGLPRPCEHPECVEAARPCSNFRGRPYVERVYSDRLLEVLLRAQLPDKFGQKMQLQSIIANLDFGRLPDEIVARLANGEDPLVVFGTMAHAAVRALGAGDERDTVENADFELEESPTDL